MSLVLYAHASNLAERRCTHCTRTDGRKDKKRGCCWSKSSQGPRTQDARPCGLWLPPLLLLVGGFHSAMFELCICLFVALYIITQLRGRLVAGYTKKCCGCKTVLADGSKPSANLLATHMVVRVVDSSQYG
jgi:hypothetical protein